MSPRRIQLPLRPKVDGFSYNVNNLLVPNRFFPFAIGQLDLLRRARNFRARWWVVPPRLGDLIPAFDTFQYQCDVANGSRLYGLMFSAIAPSTINDWAVSIVDSCTGVPLFNDFAVAQTIAGSFATGNVPVLLTQPRLILDPGLVSVEIANRSANDRACQLLLMFAEPCEVIEEVPTGA